MTIIRKAIVEVELRQKASKLEAPDLSASERAYQQEAKAAAESRKEQAGTNTERERATESSRRFEAETRRSLSESAKSTSEFNRSNVNAFRESGEGVLRFARGVAFMTASSERDLQKLIQTVSLAQGAFDIFAGGSKAITTLGAAFGPVGYAVVGVTTLLAAGAVAWNRWENAGLEAAKARQESLRETASLLEQIGARERSRESGRNNLERERIENIRNPERRAAAFRAEAEDERQSRNFGTGRRLFDQGVAENDPGTATAGLTIIKQGAENLRNEIEYRREAARIDEEITVERIRALETAQRQLEAAKRSSDPFDDFTAAADLNRQTGGKSAVQAVADLQAKNQRAIADAEANVDRLLGLLQRITSGVNSMEDKVRSIDNSFSTR